MKPADRLLNILTVITLGLTAISCLCIGSIFINPLGLFTNLGPATFPAPLSLATVAAGSTPTELVFPTFPPEWTATVTVTETALPPSDTPAPTETEAASTQASGTRTPFPSPVGPTKTVVPTDPPTRTATLPPPRPTRTQGPYPGQVPTRTPAPSTAYP